MGIREQTIDELLKGTQSIWLPRSKESRRDIIKEYEGFVLMVKHPSVGGYAIGSVEPIPGNINSCRFIEAFSKKKFNLSYVSLGGMFVRFLLTP